MSDKKHIDDLFKEQLQHFEAAPSPEVWDSIQAKMKKEKDDRKVIPLWWRLGGVAALLALLLTVGNMMFDPFGNGTEGPVLVDDNTERSIEQQQDNTPIIDKEIKDDAISSEDKLEESTEEKSTTDDIETLDTQEKVLQKSRSGQKAIAVEDQEKTSSPSPENKLLKKDTGFDKMSNAQDAVAISENVEKQKSNPENPSTKLNKDVVDTQKNEVVQTGVAVENLKKEKEDSKQLDEERFKNPMEDKDPSKVIIQDAETAVTQTEEKKDETQVIPEENKKSIFDAIAEDEEKEVAKVDDPDARQWEVTPNFGPVFYNSLDGGSSIDPMFADNSQSGDTNFSYGVQVSYAINDRLSIRSGVSNVNLGYTTGDIELATGPVASALATVDYGGRSNVLTALDKGTLATTPPSDDMNPFENLRPKSTGGDNAELTQNLSYFEVPLELNYALLDKRFGINMIGGFSTLFLGNNEIVANDGNFREVLGEANNLNSVSFSTNVGLGFNYKISNRLKFNIEPMFKYQLNPYSDSSVDFRPYYLGVYSGLSFKF
ncbi:MAG: hypothetical protein Aureis2KO_22650 [Aureisphaera sp.]